MSRFHRDDALYFTSTRPTAILALIIHTILVANGGFCMHGPPSHIDIYVGCQHNIYASYFCAIFYDHLMTTKELFTRVGGLSWVSRILDRKTFHHHQSGLSCHKNQILVILIQAQQPLRALQHLRSTVTVLKPNTNNNLRSFSPKFCIPKTHQA